MIRRLSALVADVGSRPNASRAIRRALHDPRLLLRYIRRTGSSAWIRALFASREDYERLVGELRESGLAEALQHRLAEVFSHISGATVRGVPYQHGAMKAVHTRGMYAIVRNRRPATIVETGVCNGFSTAILLEAVRRNGTGHLYSVDLPEVVGDTEGGQQFWTGKGGAVVPQGLASGWLVSEGVRQHWTLILGRSADVLPPLLERLGQIDLFIHDSEHSLENQIFEFRQGWRYLRPGGLLVASDINCSTAFALFQQELGGRVPSYFVDNGMAVIIKPRENTNGRRR